MVPLPAPQSGAAAHHAAGRPLAGYASTPAASISVEAPACRLHTLDHGCLGNSTQLVLQTHSAGCVHVAAAPAAPDALLLAGCSGTAQLLPTRAGGPHHSATLSRHLGRQGAGGRGRAVEPARRLPPPARLRLRAARGCSLPRGEQGIRAPAASTCMRPAPSLRRSMGLTVDSEAHRHATPPASASSTHICAQEPHNRRPCPPWRPWQRAVWPCPWWPAASGPAAAGWRSAPSPGP